MAAWTAITLALKLVAFLRQLSLHLARFVSALITILNDIVSFLVVLIIVLVGFGESFYFALSDNDVSGSDDDTFQTNPGKQRGGTGC